MKQAYQLNLPKFHADLNRSQIYNFISARASSTHVWSYILRSSKETNNTCCGKLWIFEKFISLKSERDGRYLFSTKSNKALISFVWPLAREEFNNVPSAFHFTWRTESRINDARHCAEKYLRGNAILLIIRSTRILDI